MNLYEIKYWHGKIIYPPVHALHVDTLSVSYTFLLVRLQNSVWKSTFSTFVSVIVAQVLKYLTVDQEL